MQKAIILLGPPGAGKSTQAELVTYCFNLIHFDTGRRIENFIEQEPKQSPIRRKFEQGILLEPLWVLRLLKNETGKIAKAGFGVVLSGSPRTILEAFGDKRHQGLIPFLVKLYGRKNIFIFELGISPRTSIQRNSGRLICSICQRPAFNPKVKKCNFCNGELIKRSIDKPAIIKVRLQQYEERTLPIIKELRKRKFRIIKIDARAKPNEIFKKIKRRIR